MNITFTKKEGCSRLLLLMAGWGMDFHPFSTLEAAGYDIAVGWDYRQENIDLSFTCEYREIVLIAWSMGVMEADRILSGAQLPLTLTVAVNGTLSPVSDNEGIPVEVFNGTLETMSAQNLKRFNKRMCGNRQILADFERNAPQRDIENLIEELRLLGERAKETTRYLRWDVAIIGSRDLIFPATAQKNAWTDTDIIEIDQPHIPDFQSIIDSLLVDKDRVAHCFNDTRSGYDTDATIQDMVAERLCRLLLQSTDKEKFDHAIEIGPGGCQLTNRLIESLDFRTLELWDIAPLAVKCKEGSSIFLITDDAEAKLYETSSRSLDLVVSASTLQWFNSVPAALMNIERILRPGGLAAIALYTSGTFNNISHLTGSTLRYSNPENLRKQLPENCKIKEWTTEMFTRSFNSTRDLLSHIKNTGVNATKKVNPGILRKMITDNNLLSLEYCCTFIIFEKS